MGYAVHYELCSSADCPTIYWILFPYIVYVSTCRIIIGFLSKFNECLHLIALIPLMAFSWRPYSTYAVMYGGRMAGPMPPTRHRPYGELIGRNDKFILHLGLPKIHTIPNSIYFPIPSPSDIYLYQYNVKRFRIFNCIWIEGKVEYCIMVFPPYPIKSSTNSALNFLYFTSLVRYIWSNLRITEYSEQVILKTNISKTCIRSHNDQMMLWTTLSVHQEILHMVCVLLLFVVVWCWSILPISFRVTSVTQGQ